MHEEFTNQCLQRTLAAATTENLKVLLNAFQQKQVIRSVYQRGDAGCLLFHLFGIKSREERRHYFRGDRGLLDATQHLITAWDQAMLEPKTVCRVVRDVLSQRQALNQAEEQSIAVVQRRISDRLAAVVLKITG